MGLGVELLTVFILPSCLLSWHWRPGMNCSLELSLGVTCAGGGGLVNETLNYPWTFGVAESYFGAEMGLCSASSVSITCIV